MIKLLIALLLIASNSWAFGFGSSQRIAGATNLLLHSSNLAVGWAGASISFSNNTITAPDSTNTADKVNELAVASVHVAYQDYTNVLNQQYTVSAHMKAGERTWGTLQISTNLTEPTYFNLTNGTIGTLGLGQTATITPAGDGWYRCTVTRTTAAVTTWYATTGTATGNGVSDFLGVPGNGLYVWGHQLETGSVATGYIPTTTVAATRATKRVPAGFGF